MILLTNDDGFTAPGLRAVWDALSPECEAIIIAPETEQSAVGHAITLATPLKVKEMKEGDRLLGYAVSGTPADCVKIAVTELLPEPPKLVISGINQGSNMGSCVIYSGTVSAATEAAIMGVPSIAVSLNSWDNKDFSVSAEFIRKNLSPCSGEGIAGGSGVEHQCSRSSARSNQGCCRNTAGPVAGDRGVR